MRLKIAIPIIWMPILTIWAFIISMGINLPIEDFELIGSIGVYLFVSFLLAIQLQLICTKKKEIFIIKLGSHQTEINSDLFRPEDNNEGSNPNSISGLVTSFLRTHMMIF